MPQTLEQAEQRIAELQLLVSTLRHGINGALSPALLMADRLCSHDEAPVRKAGEQIANSIDRVTALLKATRDVVPSRR